MKTADNRAWQILSGGLLLIGVLIKLSDGAGRNIASYTHC